MFTLREGTSNLMLFTILVGGSSPSFISFQKGNSVTTNGLVWIFSKNNKWDGVPFSPGAYHSIWGGGGGGGANNLRCFVFVHVYTYISPCKQTA